MLGYRVTLTCLNATYLLACMITPTETPLLSEHGGGNKSRVFLTGQPSLAFFFNKGPPFLRLSLCSSRACPSCLVLLLAHLSYLCSLLSLASRTLRHLPTWSKLILLQNVEQSTVHTLPSL